MYKHTTNVTVKLAIVTEDRMSAEELEEVINEIEYEFAGQYGTVSTVFEDAEVISTNRAVK